ncbi:MAG TPA: hypothetical protein VLJ61_17930 [Pyrinomonadaceae bacterium]|nr:hypothetical protein [Pyrinomonadaceae bacterium]
MRLIRNSLAVVCLLAVVAFAWLWWTRPERVDMAAYVPADSIIYVEANSLRDILKAFTSTDDWKELAPAAGVETGGGARDRLTDLISFTGIGPSDAVVLSRAQVAVAVVGFEAAEADGALSYKPRAALVVETHTSEWRVKSAVEKLVGDFARRSFEGGVSVERKEVDGVPFFVWTEQGGGRRRIVAAVYESEVVLGKDESVVQSCLDVRRGARPGLAGNEQLKEMRARLGADGALAFGFAPRGSAAKIVEVFAPAFVGGVSSDTKVQSVLATVLPQLINQTIGGFGWSSRVEGGRIEDDYFLELLGDTAQRMQESFAASDARGDGAGALLPPETYQFTRYNFRNPEAAWHGFGAALSSQVDVLRATPITLALEAMLKPLGIEQPREFLRACGPEVATAALDSTSEGKLLIASVRDRDALLAQVRARLGRAARTERAGDVEILVSPEDERGAAAFVGDYLVIGSEGDVRRSVETHAAGRTLQDSPAFKAASQNFFDAQPFALTLTDERDSARSVVNYFARRGGAKESDQGALEDALARRGYSVGETRLAENGFEKKTRSPFGLFGEIITRFAPR